VKTSTPLTDSSGLNYNPFGMTLVGRNFETGNGYRYGFNTQEQEDEIYGNGNLNTAQFWEYDTRIGKRWNLDPIKIPSLSGYACFLNNPITFKDINGDSVDLGNLYDKDDDGKLFYAERVIEFELFASSKEGKQYLLDHAQQGFTWKGEFLSIDLDISAKEEGKSSKVGIDVTFQVSDNVNPSGLAETDDRIENGRLKLTFSFETSKYANGKFSYRVNRLMYVDAYVHETFLHGFLIEQSFLGLSTTPAYSHDPISVFSSAYGKNNFAIPKSIINHAQSIEISANQNKHVYSTMFIEIKIIRSGLFWTAGKTLDEIRKNNKAIEDEINIATKE